MVVVDTKFVAYLYLPTDMTASAEALLASDPDWAVPGLRRREFRNILAGYPRRGSLLFDAVLALQAEAEGLVAGAEYDVSSPAILELA